MELKGYTKLEHKQEKKVYSDKEMLETTILGTSQEKTEMKKALNDDVAVNKEIERAVNGE